MVARFCSESCGAVIPQDFYPHKKAGFHGARCKECVKKAAAARYVLHGEHMRAQAAALYRKDRAAAYKHAHPHVKKASDSKRRALKLGSMVESNEVMSEHIKHCTAGECAYCPKPAPTVDHVIPLSRGGAHAVANTVGACFSCNSRKGTKIFPTEWNPMIKNAGTIHAS